MIFFSFNVARQAGAVCPKLTAGGSHRNHLCRVSRLHSINIQRPYWSMEPSNQKDKAGKHNRDPQQWECFTGPWKNTGNSHIFWWSYPTLLLHSLQKCLASAESATIHQKSKNANFKCQPAHELTFLPLHADVRSLHRASVGIPMKSSTCTCKLTSLIECWRKSS